MNEQFEDGSGEFGQVQSQENHVESPGVYLSNRRKDLGWSIEHVADQIKLAPRQVLAIECDDYAALPPMVVTRGFIRMYAKCLKVDVAPILAMLKTDSVPAMAAYPVRRTTPVNFSEGRFPSMGSRTSVLSKWNVGVIVLVFLLASALLAQKMGWLPDLSKVVVASPVVQEESNPVRESDVMPPNQQGGEVIESVIAPAAVPPVLLSKPEAAANAPVAATPTEPADSAEKNKLVLQAHKDSWVEIKRANKTIAFSRILKAGEVEKFEIDEPVLLTIGNAAGVAVTVRGESLDVKAGIAGNVARVNVK